LFSFCITDLTAHRLNEMSIRDNQVISLSGWW
jgi:hypothetical protein